MSVIRGQHAVNLKKSLTQPIFVYVSALVFRSDPGFPKPSKQNPIYLHKSDQIQQLSV